MGQPDKTIAYRCRRIRRGGQLLSRWVSSPFRALPNCLVIGSMKSGTTSLHAMLVQHPEIVGGYKKEIHYFDSRLRLGIDPYKLGCSFYRAYFPFRHLIPPGARILESSPSYLGLPYVAERIKALLPDAPMIVVLRNPTERAVSHYFHDRRYGSTDVPIAEALRAELLLPDAVGDGTRKKIPGNQRRNYNRHAYRYRGCYLHLLQHYLTLFPREQFLILKSEDLFADPLPTLRRAHAFLGVEPDIYPQDLQPHNVGRNHEKVSPEIYEELDAFFKPHNQALYEFLGEDFGW